VTSQRLAECLPILDWTRRGLARRLERGEASIRQWLAGTVTVPDEVGEYLETLVQFHERHPAPVRQRELAP